MNYIDYKDIYKNIFDYKLIGIGTTAYCFKLKNGMVLKLFKKNYNAKCLLSKELFKDDLDRFKNITNDTFIAPDKLVIDKDIIKGYTYPYINGKSLRKTSNDIKLLDLFKTYKKVLEDTQKISNQNFRLFDVHDGNIIYDGNIHIIDLDKCFFYDAGDNKLGYIINSAELFHNIFDHIYNKKSNENIEFVNKELQDLYYKINSGDIESIYNFLNYIVFYSESSNPTLDDIKKKIKVNKKNNGYLS